MAAGADLDARDKDGMTPLHEMAISNRPEEVRALLDAGADPNAMGLLFRHTPLHVAAMFSKTPEEILKRLVDAPVKVKATIEAVIKKSLDDAEAVVKALLAAGSDPNARGIGGRPPLHLAAAYSERPAVVKALLDAGADLEARATFLEVTPTWETFPGGEWTPLHWAAWKSNHPAVVKVLLAAGADPSAKDKEGKTPVELVPDDSPLRGTDVCWRLNEARWR